MTAVPVDTLCHGDCLDWMRRWEGGSVDLIYLDPPFKSDANYYTYQYPQTLAFEDTWSWDAAAGERFQRLAAADAPAGRSICGMAKILGQSGMLAYLTYMAERLEQIHRLLKLTGSLYLHCDPNASHYLKVLLDSIFGQRRFRSEIVWRRTSSHNSTAHRYGPIHDTILFYTRGSRYTFNTGHTPYTKAHWKLFNGEDELGRYRLVPVRRGRVRPEKKHAEARRWTIPREIRETLPSEQQKLEPRELLDILVAAGTLQVSASGSLRYKQRPGAGVPYQDIWAYQPATRGVLVAEDAEIDREVRWARGAERLGYPAQKPLGLLERIIRTSTRSGDLVLDPFCGSGTTIDAARRLDRRWCGIDASAVAVDLVKRRLAR